MITLAYVAIDKFNGLHKGDAQRLTHINFASAVVKDGKASIEHWTNCKGVLAFLKTRGNIKVSFTVGGLGAGGFSQAVATAESREVFAQSLVDIMNDFEFDGIDLDWEYPDDKIKYTALVSLLREKMGSKKLLTMAAGALASCVKGLEIDKLSQLMDFFNIMTYDMMNPSIVSHHTSLYESFLSPSMYGDEAVQLYQIAGIPKEKLVIGAAFYARIYKNVDGINLPSNGDPSDYLSGGYAGTLDFIEKAGGFSYDEKAEAPYVYNVQTREFITFDNPRSIKAKVDYVQSRGLGGIMFWEYLSDDEDSTLLKAIQEQKEYLAAMNTFVTDTPVFLCSSNNHTETVLMEATLKSNHVPVMINRRNAGDALMVYMAMSSTQADLYVPSKLYEKAKMLLSAEVDRVEDTEPDEDFLEYAEQTNLTRRSNAIAFVFLLYVLPIIVAVAFVLWSIARGDFWLWLFW